MSDDNEDKTRPDMTRIEDLSEFLHEEDPETDAQLNIPPTPTEEEDEEAGTFQTMSLSDLEDDSDEQEDIPPSFESSNKEVGETTEPDFAVPTDFSSEDENNFNSDDDAAFESSDSFESSDEDSFTSFEGEDSFGSDSSFGPVEDDEDSEGAFGSDDSGVFSMDAEDEDPILDEAQEIEEEVLLQEEVEQEIQEAMSDELDNEETSSLADTDESEVSDSDDGEGLDFEESEGSVQFQNDQDEGTEETEYSSPILEAETVQSPLSAPDEAPAPAKREDFKDINEFANAISYGQVTAGGNPPFSIILRKIKYLEDSERIIEILRAHGLCDDSNEADYQQGLSNGSMLVSQLSEYSAIFLAHKFRRFDLEILVGLADEIHPSKNYDMDYKGLIRKENLRQNKQESFSLEEQVVEVESILLSTTPTLENYRIDRYLGVVSAHIMMEESEFQRLQDADTRQIEIDPDELLKELEGEDSKTASIEIGLEEVYQNLAEALKVKAYKLKGNAVVGINYQITPLINQKASEQTPSIRYKISCTGNSVWVGGKEAPRSEA